MITRLDPSRTTLLRRQFERELRARLTRLQRQVTQLVATEDALGLGLVQNYDPNQLRAPKGSTIGGQWVKQTETAAFKAWFKDSKVVDRDGHPLVMYHGAERGQFEEFAPGSFFTEDPKEASAYADVTDTDADKSVRYVPVEGLQLELPKEVNPYDTWADYWDYDGPPNVIAANGNTYRLFYWDGTTNPVGDKNIVIVSGVMLSDDDDSLVYGPTEDSEGRTPRELPKRVYATYLSIQKPAKLPWDEANLLGKRLGATEQSIKAKIKELEAQGYDGIETESDEARFYKGKHVKQYIPFHPWQVKSATGNKGTFNPEDPNVVNSRWAYQPTSNKLAAFKQWLEQTALLDLLPSDEDSYLHRFIKQAYSRGASRAYEEVRKPALRDPLKFDGGRAEFLRRVLSNKEQLALSMSHTANEVRGLINKVLHGSTQALINALNTSRNPKATAQLINQVIEQHGKSKASLYVRDLVLRSHNEGLISGLEDLGVTSVGVQIEWRTSGLGNTRKNNPSPCKLCKPLEGKVFKLSEARGMFPRHPGCMCIPVPAKVSGEEQRKVRRRAMRAIQSSLQAAIPKKSSRSTKTQRRIGQWPRRSS